MSSDRTERQRGKFQYKVYRLKNPPNIAHGDRAATEAEERLLADLAAMDRQGWEIAYPFPNGTHFLMRRERTDWKPWDPDNDPDDDAGEVDSDPQSKVKEDGQ